MLIYVSAQPRPLQEATATKTSKSQNRDLCYKMLQVAGDICIIMYLYIYIVDDFKVKPMHYVESVHIQ